MSATATLQTTGSAATGFIQFGLWGPNDAGCEGTPVFTSDLVPVSGNGTYASTPPFTPTQAGTYRWRAEYNGDLTHDPALTACDAPGSVVEVVAEPRVTLTTHASPSVVVGAGQVSDTATLSGGVNPTGTIAFALYGPGDVTCAGPPVFISTRPVSGNGNYTSDPFTPTAAGTYRWRASYSGNHPSVSTPCNAEGESVEVRRAPATLRTVASPSVALGGQVSDTASLVDGFNPTGTITFRLFGPNNPTCTGTPVFTSTVNVSNNGIYTSGPFTPTAVGTYRWTAAYSGDANNLPFATACNADGESVEVTRKPTKLKTTASPSVPVGGTVTDTATLSGGVNPTGTITFRLFHPGDTTCTSTPVFTDTANVNGNGNYTSDPYTATAAGTYRWIAAYSGDANNLPSSTACNDPGESVDPTPARPTLKTTASRHVKLGGHVSDTATLAGGFNPTGTITFRLYGPYDTTCSGTPVFTDTVNVNGNGTYPSGRFRPTKAGTYRWIAEYSGDAANVKVSTKCHDANESVVVTRKQLPVTGPNVGFLAWLGGGLLALGGLLTIVSRRGSRKSAARHAY